MKNPKIPQIVDYEKVEPDTPKGTKDMELRWLVARHPKSHIESPHFQFRVFDIKPNGNTSHHIHAWEHVFFVVEGDGVLKTGIGEYPFRKNQFAFVPPYLDHQFLAGKNGLKMICVIPNPDPKYKLIPLTEDDWGILFKLKKAILRDDAKEVGRIVNALYDLEPDMRIYHAMLVDGMKKTAYNNILTFLNEVLPDMEEPNLDDKEW